MELVLVFCAGSPPDWTPRHNGRVRILSIQSSVAYGHVGNSAAVFPLQRLGFEVDLAERHTFDGHERAHVRDAHGNRVELLAPA